MTTRIVDGVPWVGDRSFPWASGVDHKDIALGDRDLFRERRFRLTLENGWTLSVVFGSGTYSDNHNSSFGGDFHEEVETVEVALWPQDGETVEWPEGDTVKGYVSEAELLEIIDAASRRASVRVSS